MSEVNASGLPLMVLDQILLADNTYRYRDRDTGREYTAIEAGALKSPHRVVQHLGGRR